MKEFSMYQQPKVHDEVGKFWVVTQPSPHSDIQDIVFQTDIMGMRLQFLGGLHQDEVYGFYKTKTKAMSIGKKLLQQARRALEEQKLYDMQTNFSKKW